MAAALTRHVAPGDAMEFGVDYGRQLVQGCPVAGLPSP
jgi:hypothetical protein